MKCPIKQYNDDLVLSLHCLTNIASFVAILLSPSASAIVISFQNQ
jgi:hypothetical protein